MKMSFVITCLFGDHRGAGTQYRRVPLQKDPCYYLFHAVGRQGRGFVIQLKSPFAGLKNIYYFVTARNNLYMSLKGELPSFPQTSP